MSPPKIPIEEILAQQRQKLAEQAELILGTLDGLVQPGEVEKVILSGEGVEGSYYKKVLDRPPASTTDPSRK